MGNPGVLLQEILARESMSVEFIKTLQKPKSARALSIFPTRTIE